MSTTNEVVKFNQFNTYNILYYIHFVKLNVTHMYIICTDIFQFEN